MENKTLLEFIDNVIKHYREILKYNKDDENIQTYYKHRLDYYNKLKEIVTIYNAIISKSYRPLYEKEYTFEEVKKMWEEKEYYWGVDPRSIFIYKGNKTIRIDKINKEYECYNDNNLRSLIVSPQEHVLITKTIKALEDIENENC